MSERFTVRQVAEWVGGRVEGDGDAALRGVAGVDDAGPDELTFAADAKRAAALAQSGAAAAIVGPAAETAPMPLIRVDDVQAAVAEVLARLSPDEALPPPGVHPSAVVADDAEVAGDAAVGPGAIVGAGAKLDSGVVLMARAVVGARAVIGAGTRLYEGAVVRADCVVGRGVRLGPNSVVGSDGFGYYTADGVHRRVPHAGNVVIEDDVEVGACACIDRAKFGATRIGAGTKIDNLVQVAHNVRIGRGCLLAGQTGIAGSARLGEYVITGGHVGVRDNVALGDQVRVAAFAAVAGDIPDGHVVGGIPARQARDQRRIIAALGKLPDLLKRVRDLEAKLNARESSENG
ncbi:MAG: UDP-3-O-(3-hydroxymyristoyl)glucosamine N-acyltransferase [Planctomycetota bacterium]